MRLPELAAVDAVAEEGVVDGDDVDGFVPGRGGAKSSVVLSENLHAVGPGGQGPGAFRVAGAVGWIVDIGDEDRAAAGELAFNRREHGIETLLIVGDPRLGLSERCA